MGKQGVRRRSVPSSREQDFLLLLNIGGPESLGAFRSASYTSNLVHIEMPGRRPYPSDRIRWRQPMLHDTVDCFLKVIETRDSPGLEPRWSHPENNGRLSKVYVHYRHYNLTNPKQLLRSKNSAPPPLSCRACRRLCRVVRDWAE
jgi:hypothetical protein